MKSADTARTHAHAHQTWQRIQTQKLCPLVSGKDAEGSNVRAM